MSPSITWPNFFSTLECPHRCMHDKFCIKFPNHHYCIFVMEIMWDIPFYPGNKPNPDIYQVQPCYKPWAKIPIYHKSWPRVRMSIFALGRKQKKGEVKRENSQSKSERNQKKKKKKEERKFPIKDRNKNRRNMQKSLWIRQYLNNTELSPSKRKETTT